MLLANGRIYTLDARGMIADTLVVLDGRVAFAGRRGDVNAAPGEEIVDLGGRAALPGLVDAHGHLMHLARVRLTLDLRGAESEESAARRVRLALAARHRRRHRRRLGLSRGEPESVPRHPRRRHASPAHE